MRSIASLPPRATNAIHPVSRPCSHRPRIAGCIAAHQRLPGCRPSALRPAQLGGRPRTSIRQHSRVVRLPRPRAARSPSRRAPGRVTLDPRRSSSCRAICAAPPSNARGSRDTESDSKPGIGRRARPRPAPASHRTSRSQASKTLLSAIARESITLEKPIVVTHNWSTAAGKFGIGGQPHAERRRLRAPAARPRRAGPNGGGAGGACSRRAPPRSRRIMFRLSSPVHGACCERCRVAAPSSAKQRRVDWPVAGVGCAGRLQMPRSSARAPRRSALAIQLKAGAQRKAVLDWGASGLDITTPFGAGEPAPGRYRPSALATASPMRAVTGADAWDRIAPPAGESGARSLGACEVADFLQTVRQIGASVSARVSSRRRHPHDPQRFVEQINSRARSRGGSRRRTGC